MASLPWQVEEPLLGFGVLGELLCGSQAMQHVLQFSLYMASLCFLLTLSRDPQLLLAKG